jgi:hypothetical protein
LAEYLRNAFFFGYGFKHDYVSYAEGDGLGIFATSTLACCCFSYIFILLEMRQSELAAKIGVKSRQISDMEHGRALILTPE